MKFNELNIHPSLAKALDEQGYKKATPIQEKAIPYALQGRDILGCAQTGTGKTAAFSIPILQHLQQSKKTTGIKALILTPTRELASQIQENIVVYAKYMNVKTAVIFGGVPQKPQEKAIRSGLDIVIATPGRLNDLIKQDIIDLKQVEILVLDEADRMLDMGFLNDVKKIIKELPNKKQTMFFSATMPLEIRNLTTLLKNAKTIEVAAVSSTVDKIDQLLYYVDKPNKKRLLIDLIKEKDMQSVLVFTRTKNNANRVAKYLNLEGIDAGVIHGNKSQNARQLALANFKEGKTKVLVATDIAARGIDINELSHVVNYDIPNEPESYVHRIGRTGRAGLSGSSISFCDIDEMEYIKSIQRLTRKNIPVNRTHAYPMRNLEPTPKSTRGRRNPSQKTQASNTNHKNIKNKRPVGVLGQRKHTRTFPR